MLWAVLGCSVLGLPGLPELPCLSQLRITSQRCDVFNANRLQSNETKSVTTEPQRQIHREVSYQRP